MRRIAFARRKDSVRPSLLLMLQRDKGPPPWFRGRILFSFEGWGRTSNARADYVAREKDAEWNAGNRVTARDFHCVAKGDRTESFVYQQLLLAKDRHNKASVSQILLLRAFTKHPSRKYHERHNESDQKWLHVKEHHHFYSSRFVNITNVVEK